MIGLALIAGAGQFSLGYRLHPRVRSLAWANFFGFTTEGSKGGSGMLQFIYKPTLKNSAVNLENSGLDSIIQI